MTISPSFMVSPVASCALPATSMRVPSRYAPSALPGTPSMRMRRPAEPAPM